MRTADEIRAEIDAIEADLAAVQAEAVKAKARADAAEAKLVELRSERPFPCAASKMSRQVMLEALQDLGVNPARFDDKDDRYVECWLDAELAHVKPRGKRVLG